MMDTDFRGPDASDTFYGLLGKENLALGSNRLRIIDENEASDQPMTSACGNYMLAFNGAIYNYQDIKSELIRKGQEFSTHSDTEVLLYWLKQHGAKGLADLKGMFAFVFVDLISQTILLARDRAGVKPLFYSYAEDNLVISSSLNAIISSGLVEKMLNRQAVNDYLSYRHVLGNKTFFQKIHSLEPGQFSLYSKNELVHGKIGGTNEANEKVNLKESLLDAITLVIATNPAPGLLLSGGVDSTLLLAMCRHEMGFHGMSTYTLNTGEDANWASKAARIYSADHTEMAVTPDDLERAICFLDILDQPVADHGALATWLISEKAGLDKRVLLSGAGADELFGGYNRHRAFNAYLNRRSFWTNYKKLAKALNYLGHPRDIKTFLKAIDSNSTNTYYNFLKNYNIEIKKGIDGNDQEVIVPIKDIQSALNFDTQNYLVNDVLAITDLATMAHGIEARVPFLYDDVIQAAQQIPVAERMLSKGKAPLKNMLKSYGGTEFANRSKTGFGLPMADFLRDKKSFHLWKFMDEDSPIFQFIGKQEITAMINQHQSGKKDWNMQLWSIFVLSHWLNKNFS